MDAPTETPSTRDFNQNDGQSIEVSKKQKRTMVAFAIVAIIFIALIITALYFLLTPRTDANYVARLRDVFIIIMAFESVLIGFVLVLLIIQLARLTNLLQNEIKPILDSTNETISTLRGTTQFLSSNLTEPVIKLNEYIAGFMKIVDVIKLGKRKP